jgi:hypothetical protein
MTAPTSDIVLDDQLRLNKVDFSGLQNGRTLSLSKLPALGELLLPNLSKLTGNFVLKESAGPDTLELPVLIETKDFTFSNMTETTAIDAPVFDKVTNLFLTFSELTSVDLPLSKIAGGLLVQDNHELGSLALPQLTDVTYFITLLNAPQLKQLDLSKLSTVTDVYFNNTGLSNLDSMTVGRGGSLTTTGSISIMNSPALPVCAISAMIAGLASHKATYSAGNLECACSDNGLGAVCE